MGKIAADYLPEIPAHFPGVKIDKWVVMPNHIHAILILPGDKQSLSTVIGQYKAAVSKAIHTFCPVSQFGKLPFMTTLSAIRQIMSVSGSI